MPPTTRHISQASGSSTKLSSSDRLGIHVQDTDGGAAECAAAVWLSAQTAVAAGAAASTQKARRPSHRTNQGAPTAATTWASSSQVTGLPWSESAGKRTV